MTKKRTARYFQESYRESFGLKDPPPGTEVKIDYMAGSQFHVVWPDCPDGENVLAMWIMSRSLAEDYAKEKGWVIVNELPTNK